MIQKPVNPSPNNESVNGNGPITLSCEIPKGNVEGYSVKLYSADNGDILYQNTVETLDATTNVISQTVPTDKYIQGEEYVWNCSYWRKRNALETLNCFTKISLPPTPVGSTSGTLNPEIEKNQVIAIPPSSLSVFSYKFEPKTYPILALSGGTLKITELSYDAPLATSIEGYVSSKYDVFVKIRYQNNNRASIYYSRIVGQGGWGSSGGRYNTSFDISPWSNNDKTFDTYYENLSVTMEIFTTENENIQLEENSSILIGNLDDNKYVYEEKQIVSCEWWSYEKDKVYYGGCNGQTYIIPSTETKETINRYYMRGYILLTLDSDLTQTYINNYDINGIGDGLSDNCIVKIYSEAQDINYSPDYYFQTRTPATFAITNSDISVIEGMNVLSNPSTSFGITYSQIEGSELNYFKMYLYEKKQGEAQYRQIKESKLLINSTDTFSYSGFTSGNSYKLEAVGTTTDGDSITSEIIFNCSYSYNSDYASDVNLWINNNNNSIEVRINPDGALAALPGCKIYRYDNSAGILEYVGELFSSAISTKYAIADYNIANNRQYSYIIQYTENEVEKYYKTPIVTTDFCGASIMSVIKNNDTYNVIENIVFKLSFSSDLSDVKLNIANEYISGFGEWEFESKGYVGNTQSSIQAILPSNYNRESWEKFIKDDNIKILKAMDGGIYVVGIDSASVKPHYFPSDGIINDINFSYRTLGETREMSICKALYCEEE